VPELRAGALRAPLSGRARRAGRSTCWVNGRPPLAIGWGGGVPSPPPTLPDHHRVAGGIARPGPFGGGTRACAATRARATRGRRASNIDDETNSSIGRRGWSHGAARGRVNTVSPARSRPTSGWGRRASRRRSAERRARRPRGPARGRPGRQRHRRRLRHRRRVHRYDPGRGVPGRRDPGRSRSAAQPRARRCPSPPHP
jgi:hypothetical protein